MASRSKGEVLALFDRLTDCKLKLMREPNDDTANVMATVQSVAFELQVEMGYALARITPISPKRAYQQRRHRDKETPAC